MFAQHRLRVKLHPLHGQFPVAHAHDLAVVGPGRRQQVGRARGSFDRQRVVAVDGEVLWQAGEHALPVGGDHAGLAVHQLLRPQYLPAEGGADALVAKANTQDRKLAGKVPDRLDRDSRFGRRARSRRNDQQVRLAFGDACHRDLVVTEHFHLRTQFAEVLHQVVGEAVVVVDHQ
jgi:hypothetical protein